MSNINDKATVSLFVNGEQAEDAMDRLRKKAEDLDKQLQTALAAGDKKSAKSLQRELDKVNKELNRTESAAKGAGVVLNNLSNTSIHGLRNALKHLQKELSMTKPNTEQWHDLAEKIELVKGRIEELNEELEGGQSLWSRFKSWAEDTWPAIDLLTRGYDAAVSTLREYVDAYASMDQEMANVRKFTGLTAEQVEALNEEFKNMDTRTTREGLNMLAQEAGRLGKTSTEDILGYVRAADQINIALDDLGDGATLTLSKLTGVFGIENVYGTEKSLLKVGSVVNELSQNCRASAPYLTDFAERMGGVGAQAGMTIDQIMGLGAVLDSNALKAEASSTAISQVLVRMMQDPAKYAKVAGLEVETFAEKLKTDANGALLEFLDTLNRAGGMDVLSPMFKDMGENGARAIAALSTLAIHIDEVKAQQEAAAVAFREGTSIGVEFSVQNNTVAAALEKCKNRANELRVTLGEQLYPLMRHFLTTGSAVMKALAIVVNFIAQNKGAVISLAAAIAAYNIVVNLAIIKQKLWNAALVAWRAIVITCTAASKLFAVAVALMTGNIQKARTAWVAFSNALKLSPIGLLVAAIVGLVGVVATFAINASRATTEAERLAKAQRKIADAEREAEANCSAEIATLDALYKATQDQTLAMDQRLAAVSRLQEQYPDYFKNLSQEAILAGDAADAYERLRNNIVRSAQAQARKDLLAETEGDILKVKRERDRKVSDALADVEIPDRERMHYPSGEEGKEMYINSPDHPEFIITRRYIDQVREDAAEQLAPLEKERELLYDSVSRDVLDDTANNPNPQPIAPTPTHPNDDKKDLFAEEKAWRERQEAEARIAYARGEATYSEHTARMSDIAVEYYQMLLDRADVTGDEELKIQADYWEAVNKRTIAGNKQLLAEEDRNYQELLDRLRSNHQDRLNQEGITAQEWQREQEYYAEVLELAELQHLQNILQIYEEGSDDWLEAQRRFQEKEIAAQERHLKKMESQQQMYADIKKKVFGMNQDEKDAEFARQFAALTDVYNQELAMVGDNEAEKLRIKEAYMAAELALRKEYNQEGAENSRSSYETAIGKSVEWLQGDGGKALTGTISTLTSGMSSIFSGLSSMIQAELEIQTSKIEKRYNREIELAQGNSYKVASLEKQKEKQIAKAKNEANKKMFAMQVIQAVAQTAQNALSAYGSAAAIPVVGHILAPIAAAMAVAAGAIQIAAIKKQQQASEAQGYSKGGFTKPGAVDEPAGIVHAGEWVASQKLLSSPVARPMIDALDYAQRTNTIGSLKAEDVSRSIRANDSLVRMAETDGSEVIVAAAVAQSAQAVAALTQRLNEPFVTINTVTGDHGINAAKSEYDRLMSNKSPKSRRNGTAN